MWHISLGEDKIDAQMHCMWIPLTLRHVEKAEHRGTGISPLDLGQSLTTNLVYCFVKPSLPAIRFLMEYG